MNSCPWTQIDRIVLEPRDDGTRLDPVLNRALGPRRSDNNRTGICDVPVGSVCYQWPAHCHCRVGIFFGQRYLKALRYVTARYLSRHLAQYHAVAFSQRPNAVRNGDLFDSRRPVGLAPLSNWQ